MHSHLKVREGRVGDGINGCRLVWFVLYRGPGGGLVGPGGATCMVRIVLRQQTDSGSGGTSQRNPPTYHLSRNVQADIGLGSLGEFEINFYNYVKLVGVNGGFYLIN